MLGSSRLFAAVIVSIALCAPVRAQTAIPTPGQALEQLKAGNLRFVTDNLHDAERPSRRRVELVSGQQPIAVVLACSDSRAAPEFVFDKGLGKLFVIRVAGNVGGPSIYASMEYAAAVLKTPLIVVLGHSSCGAVHAALKGKAMDTPHLQHLIDLIHTGGETNIDAAVRQNALYQTAAVTKESPLLKSLVEAGRLKVVSGVYDLHSGQVAWMGDAQ